MAMNGQGAQLSRHGVVGSSLLSLPTGVSVGYCTVCRLQKSFLAPKGAVAIKFSYLVDYVSPCRRLIGELNINWVNKAWAIMAAVGVLTLFRVKRCSPRSNPGTKAADLPLLLTPRGVHAAPVFRGKLQCAQNRSRRLVPWKVVISRDTHQEYIIKNVFQRENNGCTADVHQPKYVASCIQYIVSPTMSAVTDDNL